MERGYSVDLITGHSVDFIKRHQSQPFLLYVAHLAIHFPWQGPDDPGYRVEGGNYHNLTKLGELEGTNVSSKVNEMVEAVDGSVGAILDAVRDHGLASKTLVMFTSDNGGYLTYQGGYHIISENGPLRGQKGDIYEGGHRVPAIAWWPGRIQPGVTDVLGASFDLFPTLAELAQVDTHEPAHDGASLAPLLLEGRQPAPRTLFWRMRTKAGVRRDQWKLVRNANNSLELYDLESDIGESVDLATERPEILEELSRALRSWEIEVGAGSR